MISVIEVEKDLVLRGPDWWQRLCEMIPELKDLEETPQSPEYHSEGDVAIHTRLTVEACSPDCDLDLLWAALLHDIGKPETTAISEDGRITAHGHDKLGAAMSDEIMQRLSMPKSRRERIVWVIRNHTFYHSWQLKPGDPVSKRQRTYLTDERFPLLLEFIRIDALASFGKNKGLATYDFYKQLHHDTLLRKQARIKS